MKLGQIGIMQTNFHPYYKNILARGLALGYTLPSASQQVLQNAIVVSLINLGWWDDLDLLYIFATDGSAEFSTLNWINPSSFQCTRVNSPTHTSNQGFSSNGTSSYINTTWSPATNAVQFQETSACFGVWMHTGGDASGKSVIGTNNASTTNAIGLFDASTNVSSRLNSGSAGSGNVFTGITSFDNQKMYSVRRISSSSGAQFVDQTQVSTFSTSSTGLSSQPIYLLARNNNGTVDTHSSSTWKLSIVFFGSDVILPSDVYTVFNTYMTSI